MVVIGYLNEDGLLNRVELDKIRRLTADLEEIEGIDRMYSLANARVLMRQAFGIRVVNVLEKYETHPRMLKHLLVDSPIIGGRFLNEAGTMAMIWTRMAADQDVDSERERIISNITDAATSVLGTDAVHLGGNGVILTGLNRISKSDFGLLMGVSYVIIFLVIYLLYRRVAFVALTFGVILTSSLLTLMALGLSGRQINMVTAMLPTVVSILGIADLIHVLNEFAVRAEDRRGD